MLHNALITVEDGDDGLEAYVERLKYYDEWQKSLTFRFDYPEKFTTLPEYSAHRNHQVVIVRELVDGEDYEYLGDKMVLVRSLEDGWEGHAYQSELIPWCE
jgi:hypothetical protein